MFLRSCTQSLGGCKVSAHLVSRDIWTVEKLFQCFLYQRNDPQVVVSCWLTLFLVMFRPLEIPGHALHEIGLQRQIGVGTLVSSQERRALAVPLINH